MGVLCRLFITENICLQLCHIAVNREVSTVILLVFIERWCRLAVYQYIRSTVVDCDWQYTLGFTPM